VPTLKRREAQLRRKRERSEGREAAGSATA
jgi:hypothetical protein